MWSRPVIRKQLCDFVDSKVARQQTDIPVQDVTKNLHTNQPQTIPYSAHNCNSSYILTVSENIIVTIIIKINCNY